LVINILDLKKIYGQFNSELNKVLKSELPEKIEKVILSEMNKGNSPVKGEKWVGYSESYKDAIRKGRYVTFRKRTVPVNLKLSGKLHRSIKIKYSNGVLTFRFDSKIAEYHQNGGGKLPQRKILPEKNEEFTNKVQNVIDLSIRTLVKKYFQV